MLYAPQKPAEPRRLSLRPRTVFIAAVKTYVYLHVYVYTSDEATARSKSTLSSRSFKTTLPPRSVNQKSNRDHRALDALADYLTLERTRARDRAVLWTANFLFHKHPVYSFFDAPSFPGETKKQLSSQRVTFVLLAGAKRERSFPRLVVANERNRARGYTRHRDVSHVTGVR